MLMLKCGSSLIYNTSARYERHECDTSDTNTTRVQYQRHECYTNDTSATRVKKIDFDNGTGKNVFSHPYIYYMASERLKREGQFHAKNYLLEMSHFHTKMRLKRAPQKLDSLIAKAISKCCILDCNCKCPCTFLHNYAQ